MELTHQAVVQSAVIFVFHVINEVKITINHPCSGQHSPQVMELLRNDGLYVPIYMCIDMQVLSAHSSYLHCRNANCRLQDRRRADGT
jgi:hypothetical protein